MNKKRRSTKTALILGIVYIVVVVLSVGGLTYAFFTASVGGNDRASSTIVETAELKLVFSDTQKIEMNEALPGQAVTKTFTVENISDIEIEYTIDLINVLNEFQNGELVYSLTSTNGGAVASRKSLLATAGTLETATIEPGVTQTYTIEVLFKETGSNQNLNQSARFNGTLQINSNGQYSAQSYQTLTETMLAAETIKSDLGIKFDEAPDNTNGLYMTNDLTKTENGEVVYYYRGSVEINYVVFGNYCWRIIRTNEDGSVRLRYGGEWAVNGETYICAQTGTKINIDTVNYNISSDNKSYVNYRTSNIKEVIEDWYESNIFYKPDGVTRNTTLTDLVFDSPFCNDMSERISDSEVYFGSYDRFTAEDAFFVSSPQYKCTSDAYKYTVSNGSLTYPVGLLTADEIIYSGGSQIYYSHYLITDEWYWTMTPFTYDGWDSYVWTMNPSGYADVDYVASTNAVVPVLSLIEDAKVKNGTGVYNDPYVIMTE